MPAPLSIPLHDLDAFGLLCTAERDEVLSWLDALNLFAKGERIPALASRFAGTIKVSKSTLYRKREAFAREGWQGLRNGARQAGRESRALPEEFIQFWQTLLLSNQRKTAPAYRSLFFDHLNAGKMIPGYGGDWRFIYVCENPGYRVPEFSPYTENAVTPTGWTYRNLCRYAPEKFALTAARIGLGAASEYLPRIPTTRAGLKAGQFYVIDDVVHDILVNYAGNMKAYTPLELGALDLATGHYASWGLKPIRELDNGEKEHIRKHYMRSLLVHLLCCVGYDPDGVTILGEHGTATVENTLLTRINRWAVGAVSFEAGGLFGAPIARGLFDGRPRGNSRFKAALESHHNLKHNELANLPGQKGKDRDHSPEEMYGRDKENRALLKACFALAEERPDLAQSLSMPYVHFDQFREFVSLAYHRMATRLDHALEGFEQAGFVSQEYRLDPSLPWLPMRQLAGLPGPARSAVEMVIRSMPEKLVNCRLMSPLEAWEKSSKNLIKLSPAAAPDILGPEVAIRSRVNDHAEIVITDPDYGSRKHTFSAVLQRMDGFSEHLSRDRDIIVHLLSPIDSSFAFISTPDGAFLGVAPAMARANRTDIETLHKNLGIRQKVLAHELRNLAPVAEAKLRERAEATERNVIALTGRDPAAEMHEQNNARADAAKVQRNRRPDGDLSDVFEASPAILEPASEAFGGEDDLTSIF